VNAIPSGTESKRQRFELHLLNEARKPFMADCRPAEELYDRQTDPDEVKNLAAKAACKPILEDLRAKLDKWIKDTADKGGTPESPMEAEAETRKMRRKWLSTVKKCNLPADISNIDYLKWWKQHMPGKQAGGPATVSVIRWRGGGEGLGRFREGQFVQDQDRDRIIRIARGGRGFASICGTGLD
jgi:hypothetical protein